MAGFLLLGNLRASLTLARKLHAAGHIVHCGVESADPYLSFSRAISGAFRHARFDAQPELAIDQALAHLRRNPSIENVIPVSEVATRVVSRRRQRFAGRARLILAEDRVVEACADKAGLFALCDRIGVRLARRSIVGDLAALRREIEVVGRPCVVKPVESTAFLFGDKAVILTEGHDPDLLFPEWPPDHEALCVQSFVDGPRWNVYFGAHEGRLLGAVTFEIARTDRWDGTGYAVEGVSVATSPAVRHATEALVAALGYTGVGCAQFMVDRRSGQISFLEINPRLGANYAAAEACGLPLSLWMVEIGLGQTPPGFSDPWASRHGRRYVWTKGDLAGLKRELRTGRISALQGVIWLTRLVRAALVSTHLTLDVRDPQPTFWIYLHPLFRALGLGGRHAETLAPLNQLELGRLIAG